MSEMQSVYYAQMLTELAGEIDQLMKDVFRLLKENPEGLSRQELVLHIMGYWPQSLDGNADDRKIRKAIDRLRNRLIPIVSSSAHPGYKLSTSRDEVRGMIAEWRSRVEKLTDLINAAAKFYEMPEMLVPTDKAAQIPLFGSGLEMEVSAHLTPDGRRK